MSGFTAPLSHFIFSFHPSTSEWTPESISGMSRFGFSANVSSNLKSRLSIALKSDPEPSASESYTGMHRIGSRVRVTADLKVFHVPRVPEFVITRLEGRLKQHVAIWKGKKLSASYPFMVEFLTEIEGRGNVKFFAHLKEEEFEYVDNS